MHKKIFGFITASVVLLLAACASPSTVSLDAKPAAQSSYVVATLATNACEADTAADYTAVIVSRRTAAKLLRAGQIPVATAEAVQSLADKARALLDKSCPAGKPDTAAIAQARAYRGEILKILESKQ